MKEAQVYQNESRKQKILS